jgi:pimeloyl-ACP methyl ester carboxylesterase
MRLMRTRLLRRVLIALVGIVVVLNWTYGRLPPTPNPRGLFVEVDGLRIHYLERGGSGTAVVFVHGLPGTAEDFNEITPLLAGERTVAFDRPGYGYSTSGYFPFERQLQVLQQLLKALHLGHPILVGHSYGGALALAFAERHPSEVRGLVLLDAAAACTRNSFLDRAQARLVQVLDLPVVAPIANATFSELLLTVAAKQGDSQAFDPDPVDPGQEHRVLAINMKRGNLEAFAGEALAANGVIEGIDGGLKRVAVPAIVIQGNHDQLVKPACGRSLAAQLPDARLVMVSGGHMTPYTHPQTVAQAVMSLAAGTP